MALEEVVYSIPKELIGSVGGLILFLKTVGVIAIAYFLFYIVNAVIEIRRNKKITQVFEEVKRINRNLEDIKKILSK